MSILTLTQGSPQAELPFLTTGALELDYHSRCIKSHVSRKKWINLLQKSIKGIGVKPHHCDECLIVLQSKQFLPWGQLQRDQSALWNLSISITLLLNWKSFVKVLYILGVLNCRPPLLLPLTRGKREKDELMQEMHWKDDDVMGDGAVIVKEFFSCSSEQASVRIFSHELIMCLWFTNTTLILWSEICLSQTHINYMCLWFTNTN